MNEFIFNTLSGFAVGILTAIWTTRYNTFFWYVVEGRNILNEFVYDGQKAQNLESTTYRLSNLASKFYSIGCASAGTAILEIRDHMNGLHELFTKNPSFSKCGWIDYESKWMHTIRNVPLSLRYMMFGNKHFRKINVSWK